MYLSSVAVSVGSTGATSNLDPSMRPHLLRLSKQLLKISYTPISEGGGTNCLISTLSRNAESCDDVNVFLRCACGHRITY